MSDFDKASATSSSDGDDVVLRLTQSGIEITNWISYTYNEHFLTPSDAFSFVIGEERLDDATSAALVPGAAVTLSLNGNIQASGYIDSIEKHASRGSGVEWHITGKDKLGQAVSSGIDPTTQFKPTQSLADLLLAVYTPFGWSTPDAFIVDNGENRKTITGQKRGVPTTKKKGKVLKSFALHQLRPYPKEGAHEFAARVCERQGLRIWPTADGTKIIVGTPDFDQDPTYTIRRTFGGENNILEGSVTFDMSGQPNLIVADGFGGGGEFGHSRLRAVMANPAVFLDPKAGDYVAVFAKYKPLIPPKHKLYTQMYTPTLRVTYMHDDESKTQDELNNFLYREMALCVRKGLVVQYTMEGHGQVYPDGCFCPWGVDTVADVQDEVGGISEPMWIISRTFNKSRSGGTTTNLELVRLYALDF